MNNTFQNQGLTFSVGPFNVRVKTDIAQVANHLSSFYSVYPVPAAIEFIDFHVSVLQQTGLRRWVKPQVIFEFDGFQPFKPLPIGQAAAQFEWGLNWCVASSSHQYLIIHASVVEKDGIAIIMPGAPGSGKSTLSAALMASGWRLLSDEMALVSLADEKIYPVPRPVSLKGKSIEVLQSLFEPTRFGPVIKNTIKGEMSHLSVSADSLEKQAIPAEASFILFPKYRTAAKTVLAPVEKADTCMKLVENIFNYNILGSEGFEGCCSLADRVGCYSLEYSDLDQAIAVVDRLGKTE